MRGVLGAMAAQARGAVELGGGDAAAALPALRRAWRVWEDLGAPYEVARVRAHCWRGLPGAGGRGGRARWSSTRPARVFAELGAHRTSRASRRSTRATGRRAPRPHRARAQVLRLVAAGGRNKAIAAELVLSERTVDRHVSNIFAKLGVSSRAAATAYAYEHQLV